MREHMGTAPGSFARVITHKPKSYIQIHNVNKHVKVYD
jgi:hypothetical protein